MYQTLKYMNIFFFVIFAVVILDEWLIIDGIELTFPKYIIAHNRIYLIGFILLTIIIIVQFMAVSIAYEQI